MGNKRLFTMVVVLFVTLSFCFMTKDADAKKKATWLWPVSGGHVNTGFQEGRHHTGIDIMKSSGSKIRAAKDGKVVYSTYRSDYGNLIVIRHKKGYYSFYSHCRKRFARAGEKVSQGEKIATVGSTGRASASHLHFEIRKGARSCPLNSSYIYTFTPKNPMHFNFFHNM